MEHPRPSPLLVMLAWLFVAPAFAQDPDFERRAADAIAALERDPAAVEAVLELLQEAPTYVPLHRALVSAAERQGDWLRALRGRREIEELAGADPGDQLGTARTALALGAHDLARCAVHAALASRPDDAAAWLLAARVEASAERFEDALGATLRATALGERDAEVLLLRGEILYRLMRVPDAIDAFAAALARDPGAAERVASFALSGALAAAPSGSATSAAGEAQFAELLRLLEQAAKADPDRVNTRYALGLFALRAGRPADALRWLEPLVGRLDQPPVHYNTALAHRALGDEEAARRALERFARLEAEEKRLWEERNRVDRLRGQAAAARRAGELREAVARWQEADAADALAPNDLVAWGETLLDLGEGAAAAPVLDRALAARPADLAAIAARRRAADALGDERASRALAARAALLDPASWQCGARRAGAAAEPP